MGEGVSIRSSIWISSLITMLALALFVGISVVIPPPDSRVGLLLLGIFLALVPAIVWMGFFSQQDREEPEPRRLIARTFVFGALAAAAAAVPFATQVADQAISQVPSLPVRLVLVILSVALMQEVLKVAMVRYVVLGTSEFDRHPDGIVYGLASGLGFATIMTIAFVLRSGGVLPLAGAIRAVENALVHGALGAVSGYYIGRVKIDGKRVSWMASGLAIVTVINGLYQVAQDQLSSQFAYNPWYDLAGAAVLALGVGAVLFYFFRLAIRRAVGDLQTISVQIHARAKDMPWDIALRYDALLIGAFVLALVVGIGTALLVNERAVRYQGEELPMSFTYPAGWAVQTGEIGRFTARDLAAIGLAKPTITVESTKLTGDEALDFVVALRTVADEQARAFYTKIDQRDGVQVGGEPSIAVQYEYAAATHSGPAVISGVTSYVRRGSQLYIFQFEGEREAFETNLPHYERLLRTVEFRDGE